MAAKRYLPLLLFLLTVASTTLAGGPLFSASFLSILVAHEMGHFVVARIHKVPASLPHFIPMPPPFMLGTLGAVITMDTGSARRNQLLDIGAAGPIAGFVVAVPLMIYAVLDAPLVELAKNEGPSAFFGDSILTKAFIAALRPDVVEGFDLLAGPVYTGAWAGFLVTAINLLPMGQLDGGHVLYAAIPERAELWARRTHRLLVWLGILGLVVHGPSLAFLILDGFDRGALVPMSLLETTQPLLRWTSYAFLIWALMGKMTGLKHPPISDPQEPLTMTRRVIIVVCVFIGVATFSPSPSWVEGVWKKPPTQTHNVP